jgi:hypothetical protein
MKTFPRVALVGASCAVALLALFTPSCGGAASTTGSVGGTGGASAGGSTSTSGTGGGAGTMTSTDTCSAAADCTWGEIDKEILKAQDCMCLFGCVYLPQTKTTATRRQMQHTALCTPNKDGMGNPCPVDDCVQPGPIACVNGTCKAAPGDAGPAQ